MLIVILVFFGFRPGSGPREDPREGSRKASRKSPERRREKRRGGAPAARGKVCPLCGSELAPGERVRSIIYPGKGDTLAEVHGCPHCDGPTHEQRRICPVCHDALPPDGYVIGRMFKRPERAHLHVLGCTSCRKHA